MAPGRDDDLSAFLRSRRAALTVDAVALPVHGRRRVPGLRREELAALAGVSVSYYTRIEQGQGGQVSPVVLDALADALHLDVDEREHLHRLARRHPAPAGRGEPEVPRPGMVGIVRALSDVPAAVLGRRMDLLAWNALGNGLFAPHVPLEAPEDPATRPNWARLLFLDPRCRAVFLDWPGTARDLVGRLRASASRHPHDPVIADLVGTLSAASPEFDRMWLAHPVFERPLGTARLCHPEVGELELRDEVLRSTEEPDQLLITFHAEPGTAGERALRTLAGRR